MSTPSSSTHTAVRDDSTLAQSTHTHAHAHTHTQREIDRQTHSLDRQTERLLATSKKDDNPNCFAKASYTSHITSHRQTDRYRDRQTDRQTAIGNESAPIQLAQCHFPRLAISSAKTHSTKFVG